MLTAGDGVYFRFRAEDVWFGCCHCQRDMLFSSARPQELLDEISRNPALHDVLIPPFRKNLTGFNRSDDRMIK